MKPPSGRCCWAVAPFSPRPPFKLYAGVGSPPREIQGPDQIAGAARKGMSEFTMLVPVKARPVLVISEVLDPYDEVLALRLHRLEKSSDEQAELVRAQKDEALFYLNPESFPELPTENAVIITSLLRLPIAAVSTNRELGALNENELRGVHERVAKAHKFKLEDLVKDQAVALVERLRKRNLA